MTVVQFSFQSFYLIYHPTRETKTTKVSLFVAIITIWGTTNSCYRMFDVVNQPAPRLVYEGAGLLLVRLQGETKMLALTWVSDVFCSQLRNSHLSVLQSLTFWPRVLQLTCIKHHLQSLLVKRQVLTEKIRESQSGTIDLTFTHTHVTDFKFVVLGSESLAVCTSNALLVFRWPLTWSSSSSL